MAGSSSTLSSHKTSRFPVRGGFLALGFVLLICILLIVQYCRPLPNVEAKPTTESLTLPGKLAVTFPKQGESALGADKFGAIASTSNQTQVPIASVTKIMTAYLVLQAHPLKAGQDGPTLTMNAKDVAGYKSDAKNGYSVLKIEEGEKLTERQLLEGLMLPSGDNIADTLARWVSGSNADFVAKMNETAKALGMTKTHYEDASGVSQATVSNAVDQIKIAQEAMNDPVFREIVAMPQVTLPVAGTVYNVNGMLGKHGIVGIKTGSTTPAGGCFVSATPVIVGDDTHYIIAAVLGQHTAQSLQAALEANVNILDQARSQFKMYTLNEPSDGFGRITTAWGSNSALKAAQPVQIFGYPGMKVSYSISLQNTNLPIAAKNNSAVLKIQSGKDVQTIPLQNMQEINKASILWRFIRF